MSERTRYRVTIDHPSVRWLYAADSHALTQAGAVAELGARFAEHHPELEIDDAAVTVRPVHRASSLIDHVAKPL